MGCPSQARSAKAGHAGKCTEPVTIRHLNAEFVVSGGSWWRKADAGEDINATRERPYRLRIYRRVGELQCKDQRLPIGKIHHRVFFVGRAKNT